MGNGLPRVALWALVVLLLAGSLASVAGAQAGPTPTYTLFGTAEQPNSTPVPAGVTVDLISAATHAVFTAQTTTGGGFSFSSAAGSNAGALSPGWWGVSIPAQAHVKSTGGTSYAVIPSSQETQFYWLSSSNLTTSTFRVSITGVAALPYTQTILGNVTLGATGKTMAGVGVQLIDPTINNFVIANNTTSSAGFYTLQIPSGRWVLESVAPGSPDATTGQGLFNYTPVTPASRSISPVLNNYITYGWANLSSAPTTHVPNGGNVSLYDPTNHYIYSVPTAGPFFSVGTYPAGFLTGSPQTFDAIVSIVGYGTVWYPITVSSGNPTGGANPHYVFTSAMAPPASYNTTLNFSKGFGLVNVSTDATLLNGSTFPELPNASVGQLWAQLALDWQHNLTFAASNLPTVEKWIASEGPFFPAGQAQLTVDTGIGFNQTTNYTSTNSSNCLTFCGLSDSSWLKWGSKQVYVANQTVSSTAKTHTFSFSFRHPTHYQSINYTVNLPAGYVLQAGTAPPAQTQLAPAGVGGTWTSFTLVSNPSPSNFGTATFTAVKYSGVTANVNVSVSNFAFSSKNVLNSTHNNYTVIVGVGENATFSALNSSFPAGTNGTAYQWNFADGPWVNTSKPTTWHTYNAANAYHGSLKVTSSGGLTSSTNFTVYAGSTLPVANISVNATGIEWNKTTGGNYYLTVPWGEALHFNATSSSSTVLTTPAVTGIISVAAFNFSTGKNTWTANYSDGAGANPFSNFSLSFLGAGSYLTQGTVNGTVVPFFGWQYNGTMTVWDGEGHKANAYLVVLVLDKEKPLPVAGVVDSHSRSVTSAGVVEGANHTAFVQLWANGSSDPHNGSIVSYNWSITNKGNTSVNRTIPQSPVMPGFHAPGKIPLWLTPQSKPYTVNLTVKDRAGNSAYNTVTLTVSINTSQRPVLSVTNLTGPTSMTDGSTYTIWVNVTNTIGENSTALGTQVRFYLLPPSGSGTQIGIGGSPGSVTFYNYTNGTDVVEPTPIPSPGGAVNLKFNHTVRAQISFTPARSGTYDLWANATATNEFGSDYAAGGNQEHVRVSINQNPIQMYELWAAILIVAIVVIVAVYFLLVRRPGLRGGKSSKTTSGRSGLERGGKKERVADEEDEDDE